MKRPLGIAIALGLWLVALTGEAQSPAPVLVELDASTVGQIDGEALAIALANELHTPVVLATEETPRTRESPCLTLHALGPRRVRLVLVRPDGSTLRRTSSVHADASERLATIVILASNLLRDESGELLAMLRRRAVPEPPEPEVPASEPESTEPAPESSAPAVETPEGEPVASETMAPTPESETTSVEATPVSEPALAPPTPVETTVVPTAPVEAPPAPSAPRDPFLRLGASGQLGSVPHARGTYDLAWIAGIDVMFTPLPFLAVGVRALGGGFTTTRAWCVGGAPFVELAWRFVDVLDLHGGAGVHLQYIARDATYETAGVAPVVMAGARVYFDRVVSLALETELHFAASNVIHVGTDLLPQGAVSWTGGLSLAFHVS